MSQNPEAKERSSHQLPPLRNHTVYRPRGSDHNRHKVHYDNRQRHDEQPRPFHNVKIRKDVVFVFAS